MDWPTKHSFYCKGNPRLCRKANLFTCIQVAQGRRSTVHCTCNLLRASGDIIAVVLENTPTCSAGVAHSARSIWYMSKATAMRTKPTPSKKLLFDLKAFLDTAGAARHIERFRRLEKIYSQGDPAKGVKYIQTGGVKLSVINEDGKEAVVAILGPGDFFGEGCLAGQTVCMGTATAMVSTSILSIEKNEMMRVLRTEHALSDLFISHMLTRNIRIEEDLVDQLFNSSEKRLARALLLLARYGKEDEPHAVLHKVSQETLAEMIGTTRSRVNFFMNKFRKLGLIKYNGGLQIHASLLSVVLHD